MKMFNVTYEVLSNIENEYTTPPRYDANIYYDFITSFEYVLVCKHKIVIICELLSGNTLEEISRILSK